MGLVHRPEVRLCRPHTKRGLLGGLVIVAVGIVASTPASASVWSVSIGGTNHGEAKGGNVAENIDTVCAASAPATQCSSAYNGLPTVGSNVAGSIANTGTAPSAYGLSDTACGVATVADTSGAMAINHGAFATSNYQVSGPLSGTSLTFDGSTNWIESAAPTTGPTTYTELAWFKTSSTNGGPILTLENGQSPATANGADRAVWLTSAGKVYAGAYASAYDEAAGTTAENNGAWHFVAVTLSSAGLKLYVDGASQASNATPTNANVATYAAAYWTIGSANLAAWANAPTASGGYAWFGGTLAGVAVLPTALTATQISSLYTSATLTAYATAVAADSPQHYWGLQDAAPTPATSSSASLPGQSHTTYADTSGNVDTATSTGVVTANTTSGPLASTSSTLFDGSSGLLTTGGQSITGPQTYTELAWFKTTADNDTLLDFGNSAVASGGFDHDRLIWINSSGDLVTAVYPNTTDDILTGTSNVANGAWNLVAVTLSSSGMDLYVNGALQSSNTGFTGAQIFTGWWTVGGGIASGWAGSPTVNSQNVGFFNGSLAGVGILSTALTSSQISTLYGESTFSAYSSAVVADTPLAYWALTSSSSSIAFPDLSGDNQEGVSSGTVTDTATGPFGTGAAPTFDGSTGEITSDGPQLTGASTFTAMAWIKTSSATGGGVVGFQSDEAPSTASTYWDRDIWVDNSGKVVAAVNPTGSSQQEVTSTSTVNNGAWHFVVVTVSSAGELLYVDGSLQATNTNGTSGQSYNGWWSVGGVKLQYWPDAPTLDNTSNGMFNGTIAGVGVLPSALTSSQISSLYASTTMVGYSKAVLADSPTLYWDLNSQLNACDAVTMTISETNGSTTTCIFPAYASGTACPSVTSAGLPLQDLAYGAEDTALLTAAGGSATVTLTVGIEGVMPTPMLTSDVLCDVAVNAGLDLWQAAAVYNSSSTLL